MTQIVSNSARDKNAAGGASAPGDNQANQDPNATANDPNNADGGEYGEGNESGQLYMVEGHFDEDNVLQSKQFLM